MIQSIWIKSFRCLKELTIDFSKYHLISILSKNNTGKTSILEACYVLGHLKSFLTSDLSKAVPFKQDASYMGINIQDVSRDHRYYLKICHEGKKYINLNQESVKQKKKIQSLFRTVYISSDSLHLITSSPTYRRDQLDLSISQISPAYRKLLADYKRLVSQKNELLRTVGGSSLYFQLHEQMAPLMIDIAKNRRFYLDKIKQMQYVCFKNIGIVTGSLDLIYYSVTNQWGSVQVLVDQMNLELDKDIIRKRTSFGVHRDDYAFFINGTSIKDFYSRGVCRCVAYLFQLSYAHLIHQELGCPMLLLMDEPFSEIHQDIKHQLIQCIPNEFKVIYTSTQMQETLSVDACALFKIEQGELCRI
jgi:DNA replication and repair protein RecF